MACQALSDVVLLDAGVLAAVSAGLALEPVSGVDDLPAERLSVA
jgi:hypothetical protein